jgi:hypothetical protein
MLMATGIAMSQTEPLDVETFLRQYIKLTDDEIRQVSEGEALAKVIDTGEKPEVVIFGGVYIEAPIEDYIKVSRNVKGLEKTENYLAVEVFSDPPKLSDLDRLELPKEDIDSLKDCEVGDCEIQMVATTIETLQKTVNWKSDDRYDEVNALARKELYEGLLEYKKGGLKALGSYRDHEHERNMYDTLEALLNRGDLMPVGASKLFAYLLSYPDASLEGSEDFFYWENVKFGLKPTLRMNHVTIYQAEDHPSHPYVIANKQLYSSHYFQVAVDLSFCVRDVKRDGFYLITIKGSRQHGLTGFTGSIARRIAVGRARDGMEKGLQFLKANLEEE